MRQGTAVEATTDERRLFAALRPFLLLGGFVVLWWCLATGTAQAAESPHHELGATTKVLGATADRVVHRTTHHAVDRTRHISHSSSVAQKVTQKVSQGVRHQVAPVRAAVVKTVRLTLAKTPLRAATAPVVKHLDTIDPALPLVGEFASLQGETRSVAAPTTTTAAPSETVNVADLAGALDVRSVTSGNDQDEAAPSSPVEQRSDQHSFLQTGSTGASSAQSGSGAGTGTAVSEIATVIAPAATKTSTNAPAGRPTAGPTYPPSSSPD